MLGTWENNKLFLLLYTYSLKPSAILLSWCFSFFFEKLRLKNYPWISSTQLDAKYGNDRLRVFFSPNCFQRVLTFCLQTCQSSGMNIYWLKGKNANRRSYCARARWTSWPMGCRCGRWDGNAMRQWLNCSINSPDESLLEWLRFQICNTIDRWIVLAKDDCVEVFFWYVHFLQFGHCVCLIIPWIWSKGGLYGSAGDAWCIALWRVYLATRPRQTIPFFSRCLVSKIWKNQIST